jgi:hypothetical protein
MSVPIAFGIPSCAAFRSSRLPAPQISSPAALPIPLPHRVPDRPRMSVRVAPRTPLRAVFRIAFPAVSRTSSPIGFRTRLATPELIRSAPPPPTIAARPGTAGDGSVRDSESGVHNTVRNGARNTTGHESGDRRGTGIQTAGKQRTQSGMKSGGRALFTRPRIHGAPGYPQKARTHQTIRSQSPRKGERNTEPVRQPCASPTKPQRSRTRPWDNPAQHPSRSPAASSRVHGTVGVCAQNAAQRERPIAFSALNVRRSSESRPSRRATPAEAEAHPPQNPRRASG